MYRYYNANPLGRDVNDCSVRAISLAEEISWDDAYIKLSEFARQEAITFSEIEFLDKYLSEHYEHFCQERQNGLYLVKDFLNLKLKGRWIITMAGHMTCAIDGICYDTFDPSNRLLWCIYKVKG